MYIYKFDVSFLGRIELPLPVCNPLFYNTILKLLKMSCVTCHRFKIEDHLKRLYLVQQELLDHGLVIQGIYLYIL